LRGFNGMTTETSVAPKWIGKNECEG